MKLNKAINNNYIDYIVNTIVLKFIKLKTSWKFLKIVFLVDLFKIYSQSASGIVDAKLQTFCNIFSMIYYAYKEGMLRNDSPAFS